MPQPSPRWTTAAELSQVDVPPGGTTDQVLAKNSNADRDLKWADPGGGGGGSFLSANVARVDPSGNDGTGTVGDLTKPFLTRQAALDAIIDNELPEISAWGGIILLPALGSTEELTLNVGTKLTAITFRGYRGNNLPGFVAFKSLTITGNSATSCELCFEYCDFGEGDVDGIFIKSDVSTGVFLSHVEANGKSIVTTNTEGGLTVGSYDNSAGGFYQITGETSPQVTVFGVWSDSGGTITGKASGGTVSVINCRGNPSAPTYDDIFEVSCVDGTVNARDSILSDVDAGTGQLDAINTRFNDVITGTGNWIDSRTDSLSSGDISYSDIFLKSVPPGGTTGQALEKNSEDNFDTVWADLV